MLPLKFALAVLTPRCTEGLIQIRDDRQVVIGNCVYVVLREVGWVVGVVLALFTGEEASAAIEDGIRLLPIHITDRTTFYGDVVGGDA